MGQIVIACYRPKPGQEQVLRELTRTHVAILRRLGLATSRPAIAMAASDGTIVEVFEWVSADAIEQAHTHPAVFELWVRYGAACDYVPLTAVPGTDAPFAGFTPVPSEQAAAQQRGTAREQQL